MKNHLFSSPDLGLRIFENDSMRDDMSTKTQYSCQNNKNVSVNVLSLIRGA